MVTSYDQSARTRCPEHGHAVAAVFCRPEPEEHVTPKYVCLHCWVAAGSPDRLTPVEVARINVVTIVEGRQGPADPAAILANAEAQVTDTWAMWGGEMTRRGLATGPLSGRFAERSAGGNAEVTGRTRRPEKAGR